MEQKIRQIPYGVTDFVEIRKEDKYYVDKTGYISKLEVAGNYLMFLRPRRFGKSLFLSMLSAYYDVWYRDQFDELFSGLSIYDEPTPKRNSYLVMKLNFSTIDPDPRNVNKSFNDYLLGEVKAFVKKYIALMPRTKYEDFEKFDSSYSAFNWLSKEVQLAGQKMYLIIDEYDNFANTLLADNEQEYTKLTHGDGFFRLFFNVLKASTTDNDAPIGRILISGVTPLCLSDVTSGYNIGRNISLEEDFNSMVGFTDNEIRQMFEYYRDATGVFKHSINELIDITRPWYDNNCFNHYCLDVHMYNSDMTLYFLNSYSNKGRLPEKMVDDNVRTDYNKMVKLIKFEKNFGEKASTVQRVANDGEIFSQINSEFALKDLEKYGNLLSLMFYMGLLSIGRYEKGCPVLIVPNNTVRQNYFDYMLNVYDSILEWRSDTTKIDDLGRNMAWDGEHEPMFRYIASCMSDVSSVRDFAQGEAFVKGFMQAQFGANLTYFTSETEKEVGHGYTDISLTPRLGAQHRYVIELKYVNRDASEEKIDRVLEEARPQLAKYISDHKVKEECDKNNWYLHGIVMVFKGWEMVRYEEE